MEREWAGRHREGMGLGPPIPPSFSPLRPSSAGHLGVGSLHGRGDGNARGQFLSGALGWRGPRNCKGLSSLPWVQKSVGSGGQKAPCLATKKRRLWAAGCWFIYCRVSRAIKAPSWDGKTIYTAGGGEPGPMLLTAQNGKRTGWSWVLQT